MSVTDERTANMVDPIRRFRELVSLRLRVIGLSVGMPAMLTSLERQQRIAPGVEATTTRFIDLAKRAAPPVEDAPDAA